MKISLKIQIFIRSKFKNFVIGVEVIPVPMFETLDYTNAIEYDNRVEPSAIGGNKIAAKIMEVIKKNVSRRQLDDKTSELKNNLENISGI